MEDGRILSHLRINRMEFHDRAIVCESIWREGGRCLAFHRIDFEIPEKLGELDVFSSLVCVKAHSEF